jgi:hypothetical protein
MDRSNHVLRNENELENTRKALPVVTNNVAVS